jgi:hypothetical protein
MKNIKQVVKNKEWQTLRRAMEHTWNSEPSAKRNLSKLKKYLNNTKNENKLRRVHNYLGALRGVHYPGIAKMRREVKKLRQV